MVSEFRNVRVFFNQDNIKQAILDRTREKKDIIFGAQSIRKRIGIIARPTIDYDIFTKKPKESASIMEKKFDNIVGFDYYYVKKGKNPGTWKVKSRGVDLRKGTRDDVGILDYTKTPSPTPSFSLIGGIRYRTLGQEAKAKRKAIKDPAFKFRKKKDMEDLNRINFSRSSFI